MRREKILWSTVLIVSLVLLIVYGILGFNFIKNNNFRSYAPGNYYGRGMMNGWTGPYNNQQNYSNKQKMSVDQIKNVVDNYIQGYNNNLVISDIVIFKDTDYYVSIVEKDTGKGAVELMVNPYTGNVYPENGPDIAWNQKYGMHGGRGYGMMGNSQWNGNNGYYQGDYGSKQVNSADAVKAADTFVKNNVNKSFSVVDQGNEFYGYYTFLVNEGNKPVGLVSVNYYTGAVWYHNWLGQLDSIISQGGK